MEVVVEIKIHEHNILRREVLFETWKYWKAYYSSRNLDILSLQFPGEVKDKIYNFEVVTLRMIALKTIEVNEISRENGIWGEMGVRIEHWDCNR